ncbi:hypothetical protein NA56DRAFT_706854 [Hyaloscypha hepaticicola]|uniref:Uncharacterized protein n=1 Tax=Hyaloscypha hepaticicola TaxID=2082293 RepID=A0A2J6PW44_9HELO|nr:hypothetical protein NA56DRAFT_706854 [Hyaloscypha hepaticicola]
MSPGERTANDILYLFRTITQAWMDFIVFADENNDSERSPDMEPDTTEYPSRILTFEIFPFARVTPFEGIDSFSSVFAGQFRSAQATEKGAVPIAATEEQLRTVRHAISSLEPGWLARLTLPPSHLYFPSPAKGSPASLDNGRATPAPIPIANCDEPCWHALFKTVNTQETSQTILVRSKPLFGPQTVRRILLQLHPSAKPTRGTREVTVHLVILYLSTCVDRIASLPFSGPGQRPTAVRQVAVPNAPLLGIDVSIGEFRGDPGHILGRVSWIALES